MQDAKSEKLRAYLTLCSMSPTADQERREREREQQKFSDSLASKLAGVPLWRDKFTS